MAKGINIKFPVAGENQRGSYSQSSEPYSTPRAVNVRSVGVLERRGRGGSRPCLSKLVDHDFGTNITAIKAITYPDSSGATQHDLIVIADGSINLVRGATITTTVSYLVDGAGRNISISGDFITYESTVAAVNPIAGSVSNAFQIAVRGRELYIASSTVQKYDPVTGVVSTVANAPINQPLVSIYQDRIVLSGADHTFGMSAMGDFENWTLVDDFDNPGRAFGGTTGSNGLIGGKIVAQHTWGDNAILFASTDGLWVIYGNPAAGGRKEEVSNRVGCVGQQAGCVTDSGLFVFLSKTGLYTWQIGSNSAPEPFSKHVVPTKLRDVSVASTEVLMAYDDKCKGIHLFLTPRAATAGEHWFLDLENRALWPVVLGNSNHQPYAIANMQTSGDSDVVIGGKDGYIRYFSNSASTDDGTNMGSDLVLGPIKLGAYGDEGQIVEMLSDMADNSAANGITWRVIVAKTAEECVDLASSYIDGTAVPASVASGTWTENHNRPVLPRSRGAWACIWLEATGKWAYEDLIIFVNRLGRLR